MKKYIPFLILAVFPNYIALYFIAGLLISSAMNIGALNPFSNASLVINGILYLCSVIVSVIGIVWLNRKKEAFEDVFTIKWKHWMYRYKKVGKAESNFKR